VKYRIITNGTFFRVQSLIFGFIPITERGTFVSEEEAIFSIDGKEKYLKGSKNWKTFKTIKR